MAIRFVDVASEEGGKAKPAPVRQAREPSTGPVPVEAPPAGDPSSPPDEAPLPGLNHAKPEPKARGRKKPLSSAGADRPKAVPDAPTTPLLDGLLPEPQAHAKPTPKPRGRKKAFG